MDVRRGRCPRSEASTLGVHRPAHRAAVSFRASDRCHWRGNPFPAPAGTALPPYTPPNAPHERPLPLPLGEVAERSEDGEGKQKRTALRAVLQLVDKPLPCKACVEHPKGTCFAARSDYFRAARRHKNNDIIFRLSKKPPAFSTAKKHPRVLFCFASSSIMPHQPRQQQRRQQPQ